MLNKFLTFVIIIVRLALNLGSGCNFQVSIGFMDNIIEEVTGSEYKYGFVTNVETDTIGKGLNEEVIRITSSFKPLPIVSVSTFVTNPYLYSLPVTSSIILSIKPIET